MQVPVLFFEEAKSKTMSLTRLGAQYRITGKIGYKRVKRKKEFGSVGLKDRSRRPKMSPNLLSKEPETDIFMIKKALPYPNEMRYLDFRSIYPRMNGTSYYLLTILDDYSCYALALKACAKQNASTPLDTLDATFRKFDLPETMLVDKGALSMEVPASLYKPSARQIID